MYNNNFNSYGASSFGNASQQGMNTQYQGFQKQYQPVGYVQSFYGQNLQGNQGYAQATSTDAYHTANYRGNQIGHDAYLRSDSQTPAQASFQTTGISSYNGINAHNQFGYNQNQYAQQNQQYGIQNQQYGIGQFGNAVQANQSYGQAVSPNAYHTANYRGNQLGHDNYLRSDSATPAQQQTGVFQGGIGSQGYTSYNTGINNVAQQFGFNSAY